MTFVRRAVPTLAAIALPVAAVPAQTEAPAPGNEIVVSAPPPGNEIVVNGRAIHCRRGTGDPLDGVRVPGWPYYTMIVPDGEGGFVARQVTEQITGPEFWQRVGFGMGAYRFRGAAGGQPMCIGGRGGPGKHGGFRRIVDAVPYRGHRVRFTAWAATGGAGQVSFWLAAGSNQLFEGNGLSQGDRMLNGGNTNHLPFGGNHGWTPVLLETGPIDAKAGHISYGFNLQGAGDVWVYDPRLEVIADPPAGTRTGDVIAIGHY